MTLAIVALTVVIVLDIVASHARFARLERKLDTSDVRSTSAPREEDAQKLAPLSRSQKRDLLENLARKKAAYLRSRSARR